MTESHEKGYTFAELLAIAAILGILVAAGCGSNFTAFDKAREEEVKANIHIIQVALERYADDLGGSYPKQIWGGDLKGWAPKENLGCRTMWPGVHPQFDGTNEDTAAPPIDPLIYYGYLKSYPGNPFIDNSKKQGLEKIIKYTGPKNCQIGDGDPRFGYDGSIMGNILEDPRYLWSEPGKITRIKNCFLNEAKENNISMIDQKAHISPFYSPGCIPATGRENADKLSNFSKSKSGDVVKVYWPGEFFYRSCGKFVMPQDKKTVRTIWDFKYSKINRYILGGFGSLATEGMDIIHLVDLNGTVLVNTDGYLKDCYYDSHPGYPVTRSSRIYFSSPEVFGGGSKIRMPWFPYYIPKTGEFIYGSPDGIPDGVIIVRTAEG